MPLSLQPGKYSDLERLVLCRTQWSNGAPASGGAGEPGQAP